MNKSSGFTLIELLITMVIIGIMSSIAGAVWMQYTSLANQLAKKERYMDVIAIKNTLLKFSALDNNGRLPAPYNGGDYNNACLDTVNVNMKSYFSLFSNSHFGDVNNDGSISKNVRVCQRVTGLTYQQSVSGFNGAEVLLNYDVGVVYQTNCSLYDTTCNTGVPGDSLAYTATGWATAGEDGQAVEYSTLSVQQAMWSRTYKKLTEISDVMKNYRFDLIKSNAADDTTNWNLGPTLSSEDMSGQSAAANQGCYDGWYDLKGTNIDILSKYGMNKDIYSITEFGGVVEYCRNYDPADKGVDTLPHLAAIRVNKNVSQMLNPDNANIANNLIISF